VPLVVNFVGSDEIIAVVPPQNTIAVRLPRDYEPKAALQAGEYGPTKAGPIGHIVHARSGVSLPQPCPILAPFSKSLTLAGQGWKYVPAPLSCH
jgi:hypothetical protein